MIQQLDIFGLKVSDFELNDVLALYNQTIKEDKSIVIFGHSLGYITLFKKYPELYNIINSFDLLVCDGTQFNWYCKQNNFKLKTVISIPDITISSLAYANTNSLKILLFGAKESINDKACERIKLQYPNITILPGINGYFNKSQELEIVSKINDLKPHILLIGISTPIKEHFVHKYKDQLNSNIIIPCGGMIDVLSGYTKQSPGWIKKIGFATPYRIIQEPKRLFWLHTWMVYEILFKILPITIVNKFILRKKEFNLVQKYLKK